MKRTVTKAADPVQMLQHLASISEQARDLFEEYRWAYGIAYGERRSGPKPRTSGGAASDLADQVVENDARAKAIEAVESATGHVFEAMKDLDRSGSALRRLLPKVRVWDVTRMPGHGVTEETEEDRRRRDDRLTEARAAAGRRRARGEGFGES